MRVEQTRPVSPQLRHLTINTADFDCPQLEICDPNMSPDNCFFCMTKSRLDFGQNFGERFGTSLGCYPAQDYPADLIQSGLSNLGKRFLMKYAKLTQGYADLNNRDARGYLHDLRANEVRLVPRNCSYIRAPLFYNIREDRGPLECIADACTAVGLAGQNSIASDASSGDPARCPAGESIGEPIRPRLPDCFFYIGLDRIPRPSRLTLFVRSEMEHNTPKIIAYGNTQLYNAQFTWAWTNQDPSQPPHVLTPNLILPCTERVIDDADKCNNSYAFEEARGTHYANNNARALYDFVRVNFSTAKLADNGVVGANLPFVNKGEVALRERTLAHVASTRLPDYDPGNGNVGGGVNFDQLDKFPGTGDVWERSWNGNNFALSTYLPRVEGVDLKARLRLGGVEIPVEYVITSVFARLELVVKTMKHQPNHLSLPEQRIYPYCKLHLRINTGVRLIDPQPLGEPLETYQKLIRFKREHLSPRDPRYTEIFTLTQPDIYSGLPRLYKDVRGTLNPAEDTIEYSVEVDGKRTVIDVPRVVEWWGAIGDFSNPRTPNLGILFGGIDSQCIQLANRLNLDVPGHYWYPGSRPDDPGQKYAGYVNVRMPA